jgi:glycosyltransferase involved in cell wall biosynthesis
MKSYNHASFLAESIDSVLGQDFDDFELLIVDDASSDASRQIIDSYAVNDPRIQVIFHESNKGISKTVNDGIEKAKGRFIAQIDSDDVWVPNKLTKQLAVLERDEDLIVWSEGEIIDRTGRSIGKSFSERISEKHGNTSAAKSGHVWQGLLSGNFIFGSTVIYKKRNLGDVRYDEGLLYINDYKFYLELARQRQFHYIAEPLAKYRIHGDNTIAGSGAEALKRQQIAGKEYISIVEDAMQQYDDEITRETRAVIYGLMGAYSYDAGEKKKGLGFFLRAAMNNPLEKRNFLYIRFAFQRMLRAVSLYV